MPRNRLLARPVSHWLIFACAFALLLVFPAHAATYSSNGHSFTVTPLPGWVDRVDVPASAGERPGEAVAYRLVDRQVYISESGETQYSRLVTQPLNEAGLQHVAELEVSFNPAFQTLALHHVQVVRNGRAAERLKPEQVRLIQREEDIDNKLFDGIVTALIIVDDVRVNDQVDLSYSVTGRNPVFGNRHFSAFSMGWGAPVDQARVRVSVPKGRKLYTRDFNGEFKPQVSKADGRVEYRWARKHTPAVHAEDDAPVWHQPFPGIQITEYRRWRDVAGWAEPLYRHNSALPAELKNTLAQWQREDSDKKRLAARALKLVQDDVRYFGIEMGQNSHRPSPPQETWERRYGDCKDKTTLLIAMLDELGIPAYPALVSTDRQRDIDNWLPSPGMFDHVIVMTELDGKHYWLDGTRTYQQGSLDTLAVPDYERALVVRKGENRLTPIEVRESAVSGFDIEEEFRVTGYNQPVALVVRTTYRGSTAETMRRYFATSTPAEISRSYVDYYARMYPSIAVDGFVESRNDPVDNRFVTVERYQVENFWEPADDGHYASLLGSTLAPYVKKPGSLRREAPLAISHPVRISHQSTIVYPEDIDYEIEQPEITFEGRFADYQRAIQYGDRRLTVTHRYHSRKDTVMPNQIGDYVEMLARIRDNLEYTTWLSDLPQRPSVAGKVNDLLQRLDTLASH